MHSSDQVFDTWTVFGSVAPESVAEVAIPVDDEVAAQLEGVFDWSGQPCDTVGAQDLDVSAARLPPPHATNAAPAEAESAVGDAFGADKDRKPEVMLVRVGQQGSGAGERHEGDAGVASEFDKTVADRDCVGGTGQSMDVAMKDQDDRVTLTVGEAPTTTVCVVQIQGRRRRADSWPGEAH